MNPALLIIINLLLFLGTIVAGFRIMNKLTAAFIGYFRGARAAVYTDATARSRRKHSLLLAGWATTIALLSLTAYTVLTQDTWCFYVLSPTLGLLSGSAIVFKMDRSSLKE